MSFRYRLQRVLLLIHAILNFNHSVFLPLVHVTGELQVQVVQCFCLYNLQQLSFSNRGFCCWYTVQINFRASANGTRHSSTTGAEVSAVGTCYIYTSTTTGAEYLMLGHATIILQIMTFYLAHGVAHFRYRSSAACIEYATTYLQTQ